MADGVLKQFDYYYGVEAESFNFIQVPRFLFINEDFKSLKSDSKILYSFMLDRMSLSRKNQWFDEHNRVYIIFPLEEIQNCIGCGHSKCVELLKELSSYGLIERVKRGQGYPDIIYVKDFLHAIKDPSNPDKHTDFRKSEFKTSDDNSDFRKTEFKTSENQKSRLPENEYQEIRESEAINTNNINTNFTETEMSYNTPPLLHKPKENVPTRFEEEEEKVKNQINYTKLKLRHPANKDLFNSIVVQMTEMMCETKNKTEISMNSFEDTSKVKEKLSQITYDDIENNLLQLLPDKKENSIKNPKGYLRRCLINLVDRRDTVCYTKEIKGNKHHSEYDFEAMEREFGLR